MFKQKWTRGLLALGLAAAFLFVVGTCYCSASTFFTGKTKVANGRLVYQHKCTMGHLSWQASAGPLEELAG